MPSVHLFVLIHGMWGFPEQLDEMHRIASARVKPAEDGTRLEILRPISNSHEGTYDGVDWGAERVADEVCSFGAFMILD